MAGERSGTGARLAALTTATLCLALVTVALAARPAIADHEPGHFGTDSSVGDTFDVNVYIGATDQSGNAVQIGSSDGVVREYTAAPACRSGAYRFDLNPVCLNGDPITETCLDGTDALDPLWMRELRSTGAWSAWSMITWYHCPNDAGLMAAIQNEWTSLEPLPSEIVLQPDTGWVFASVPTVAMAEDDPRLHDAVLLGVPVRIRATAATYTWTWGDGERLITSDPGRPYPNATVTHTYLYYEGPVDIGLSTTWTGEYSINGGSWNDFSTTISTTTTPVPVDVLNPHHHLVECEVGEGCTVTAAG